MVLGCLQYLGGIYLKKVEFINKIQIYAKTEKKIPLSTSHFKQHKYIARKSMVHIFLLNIFFLMQLEMTVHVVHSIQYQLDFF